jgi:hypothetical protein
MAAAERTRGARDIICSYDLSKARTRITLLSQHLWLVKGSLRPIIATGIAPFVTSSR